MRKFSIVFLAGIAAFALTTQAVHASYLLNFQTGSFTFDDDSREMWVPLGDRTANPTYPGVVVGDLFVGFSYINRIVNNGSVGNTEGDNGVYFVFAQRLTSVNLTTRVVEFGPTTDANYGLGALLGSLATGVPASAVNNGLLALISAQNAPFSKNLTSQDPGDVNGDSVNDYKDYFALLANEGELMAIFGLNDAGGGTLPNSQPDTGDFFRGTEDPDAPDWLENVSVLSGPPKYTGSIASFSAGLSTLYQHPLFQIAEDTQWIGQTLADLGITGGTLRLAGTNNGIDETGVGTHAGTWTFADSADGLLNATVVPEPSSMLAWLGLLGIAGARSYRRKQD